MQTNLEQAKQVILQLPPEELEQFDKWFETRKEKQATGKHKKLLGKYQIERYKKARKWLDEHGEEYMNQWVCLEGDRLIAHRTDAMEVHRKAGQFGIATSFVHHIVPEVDMGGW